MTRFEAKIKGLMLVQQIDAKMLDLKDLYNEARGVDGNDLRTDQIQECRERLNDIAISLSDTD